MTNNLPRKLRKKLIGRARELLSQGYSVIPIRGDLSSSEPKKPTMKWRAFQKRIADVRDLDTMFDGRAGALGIVCGQVSRLVVIDFDDHFRYQRFCRQLPQFASSYTVKTKRGYHVYYRTGARVPSHQFEGGDIKGEKSYVVAAPSVIAGCEYRAVNGAAVMALEEDEVVRVLRYFHVGSASVGGRVGGPVIQADVNVAATYEKMQGNVGRNNALYHCASMAAAQGMSGAEIERALLRKHVMARAAGSHKAESLADRYREGRRTIASALKRGRVFGGERDGIPNSVRERLLQAQKSSVTARLLDVMVMAGWRAEALFRMRDAIAAGKRFGLARKSVIAALTGELSIYNGRHIVGRRYGEYLDIRGLKCGGRGRPVQLLFQMPSVGRLLNLLGVRWSPSDRLRESDLCSSRRYREALHREYVKRLSPQASMRRLASRLGVDERTVRRYNARLGVHVCERIGRFELSWDTLKCLPRLERGRAKTQTPGYWLALGQGARLPAWRHIGAGLLRRGEQRVRICALRGSVKSLGKPDPVAVVYESMTAESFMRLRMWREDKVGGHGLLGRLREAVSSAGARLARARYEKLRLRYDTVAEHIAEDKTADTIRAYLFADDGAGGEVRRPARRGVAYRMLKQFGEGNVFLALRDSYGEVMAAMAGHAARVGEEGSVAGVLAQSMS